MLRVSFIFLIILIHGLSGLGQQDIISLEGEWFFAMDESDVGLRHKWEEKLLRERVRLPGSMNTNGKGNDVTIDTKWTASIYDSSYFFHPRLEKYRRPYNLKLPFWLTPDKHYIGAAWYSKDIDVPQSWKGRPLRIFLERVHISSDLWVDGERIDTTINSLSAPHTYFIKSGLTPGKHTITLRIDNRLSAADVGKDSHSVTDHTQGNWNGVIGKMYVEALTDVVCKNMQVYPDEAMQNLRVEMELQNLAERRKRLKFRYEVWEGDQVIYTGKSESNLLVPSGGEVLEKFELPIGNLLQVWDEFHPQLYTLKIIDDELEVSQSFGWRKIGVEGKHLLLNGQRIFLRGDVNNCEFPLTGYPPMDTESWMAIFQKLKRMGINHIRFHSWCPPDAAFTAADITGIYLQAEAPTWANHGTSLGDGRFIDQYVYDETNRMVDAYGNHPSFIMMAAGNEPAGKNQVNYLTEFIRYWREKDTRRIYTGASVAMSWPLVPENDYMVKSAARGLDWKEKAPGSMDDFSAKIDPYDVPFVTHEQGQWCTFPDFTEIEKYTGAFKARNFEMFKEDLSDHGMEKLADDFLMASGKLQALCYKMELERSLRTPELSGFQLLGVQDFPGQGTALVGVLNAFYGEKGYISEAEFARFCNETVPLMKTEKFVWQNDEVFKADVAVYHYGAEDLIDKTIHWKISQEDGNTLSTGEIKVSTMAKGGLGDVGSFSFPLKGINKASKLHIELSISDTPFSNGWDIWVYPQREKVQIPNDIMVTDTLNFEAIVHLMNGGKVFLDLHGKVMKGKEVIQSFTPVFWNTSWFKMRPPHTTGLLIDEKHPAFKDFPTSYHSDLQWWEIVNDAQVIHLEDFPKSFKPLVRNIDTWFMNRRLATIFEAKAGEGKIIVSSADLVSDHENRPAAKQLFESLISYMKSEDFNPQDKIGIRTLMDLSRKKSELVFDPFTKDGPDELR